MAGIGLLLDFGGVLTSSLHGRMAEFCVAAGLPADAIVTALTGTEEGRSVTALAEAGLAPQRDFELMLAGQLGLPADGLIAALLDASAFTPRPETIDLARRARTAGIATGLLSNSWGGGGYDVYAGYDLTAMFDAVVDLPRGRPAQAGIADLRAGRVQARRRARRLRVRGRHARNVTAARELGMAAVHFTGEPDQLAEVERLLGLDRSPPGPGPRRRGDG